MTGVKAILHREMPTFDARTTLVVVDMQAKFAAANEPWMIEAVRQRILAAMAAGAGVVFLEFFSMNPICFWGPTDDRLLEPLRSARYGRWAMQPKAEANGAESVLKACSKIGPPPLQTQRFVLVGVHTMACVAATAEGLLAGVAPEAGAAGVALSPATVEIDVGACNDRGSQKIPELYAKFLM